MPMHPHPFKKDLLGIKHKISKCMAIVFSKSQSEISIISAIIGLHFSEDFLLVVCVQMPQQFKASCPWEDLLSLLVVCAAFGHCYQDHHLCDDQCPSTVLERDNFCCVCMSCPPKGLIH